VNLRRVLALAYRRLVASAEAGGLTVHSEGRMRPCTDEADVDAWLTDRQLPSVAAMRANGPSDLAALGVGVG
jgi:hypothetical protein